MTMSEPFQPTLFPQTALPSMSSPAASPARTSRLPGRPPGLTASGLDYGPSSPDLLASYDLATSSWRTSQRCLLEGLAEYSETWPRSGMMRNGTAYRLPPLVPLTAETASGSSAIPTPVRSDAGKDRGSTAGFGLRNWA